jgi:CPA1 family monovalent cation:H+ antiporter
VSEVLVGFPLLSELGANERAALRDFLEARELAAGRALFMPGEEAAELYLVDAGRVRLERDGRVLGYLERGDSFGALALLTIGRRECAAIAHDDTRLLSLSREAYLRLRREAPALALELSESILRGFTAGVRPFLPTLARGSDAPA